MFADFWFVFCWFGRRLSFEGITEAEKLIKISHITKLAIALALFHRCHSQIFPLFLSSQIPCVATSYFDWLTVVHFSTSRNGVLSPMSVTLYIVTLQ